MSDSRQPDPRRPHPTLQRIDIICDGFEAEWLAGRRPEIRRHLELAAQRDRPAVFVELLRMEIEYRERTGESPAAARYVSQYPEYESFIRQAFGEPQDPTTCASHDDATVLLSYGTLGVYQLLEKLGQGGMGKVYKARHQKLNRIVAIKVLPDEAADLSRALRRVEREMQVIGALDHPNIVRAMDAGEVDGTHFLVMEFVDGQDLSRLLKDDGPLPVAEAVDCIRQAAVGLAYAHHQGVVHRDVKPANLLLDTDGIVKILDLGLARLESEIVQHTTDMLLTRTDQVMGTFDYMSPEQAVQTRDVDHRTDIYSLGCTLYTLLTCKPLFSSNTPVEKVMAHRSQPPPRLRSERSDVPETLEAVFQKMVAKKPADRYATMDEVIAALDGLSVDLSAAGAGNDVSSELFTDSSMASLGPSSAATAAAGANGRRGSRLYLGLIAAVLLIAVAAAAVYGWFNTTNRGDAANIHGVDTDAVGTDDSPQHAENDSDLPPSESINKADPPPLAAEPLDRVAAQDYQRAWAEHLGVPVATTIELPGEATMAFVLIPPGEFVMGSTKEETDARRKEAIRLEDKLSKIVVWTETPQHTVTISKPFYLGKHEMTQEQWQAVMGTNPSRYKDPTNPVESVSWHDVQKMLVKLNELQQNSGRKFALPTEAQWEYACRAGTTTDFHFGNEVDRLGEFAWYGDRHRAGPFPVGRLQPNAWGLNDMHGNVCEWCADAFDPGYYRLAGRHDPAGPLPLDDDDNRVCRGGSWNRQATHCRSRFRDYDDPTHTHGYIGLRLLLAL